jgi:hypothetical protein
MGRPGSFAARTCVALALFAPIAAACSSAGPGARAVDAAAPEPPPKTPAADMAPPMMQPIAVPRLPARVRRLSNSEVAASVAALLPGTVLPSFAPDTRQSRFTENAAQQVDPLYAAELQDAFHAAATTSAPALVTALGCSAGDACAARFIADFVTRAWRRPLAAAERADLLDLFHSGALGATFRDGVALVVEAALQSASFLYLTELGAAPATGGEVRLAPHEAAAALAYLVTGGPPDAALVTATEGLVGAAGREAQARRLLQTEGAQHQVQRFVKEWLGLDQLGATGKANDVYPDFAGYRSLMVDETDAYIVETVFHDEGSLRRLLTADYTIAGLELARYYGLAPDGIAGGRASLRGSPRKGLLTQASFLSVYAHADSSAPVKRGAAVLERLLCMPLPLPSDIALTVVPPRPDPTRTTRARYEAHVSAPPCAACHALIDPIGFAFEGFDGAAVARTEENGQPVVTAADLDGGPLDGHVDGAAALLDKLAASPETEACFARNFFRFAAATADPRLEDAYVSDVWTKLPAERRGRVQELFVSWASSDMFITRAVSP